MSFNRENMNIQTHSSSNNLSNIYLKQNLIESTDNYSPFIIKRSNTIVNSCQPNNPLNSTTSMNFKMYTPSPNVKEKFSDRYIPCKGGLNLLAQFEMTTSNNQHNEEAKSSYLEINLNNIESFSNQHNSNINSISTPAYTNLSLNNSINTISNQVSPKKSLKINANYAHLLKTSILGEESYTSFINNSIMSPDSDSSKTKIFRFKTESKKKKSNLTSRNLNDIANNFAEHSQEGTQRKINKNPFKILDAPNLMDDFYLNLVDWSSQNDLSVGLMDSVYIWSANKSRVTKLCQYGNDNYVSSLIWNSNGSHVSVGTSEGLLDIWDGKIDLILSANTKESKKSRRT